MKETTYSVIFTKGIVKESEKALCITCIVSWNANGDKMRDIWFPKSVVKGYNENSAEIADWFLAKKEDEGAFRGYRMIFDRGIC